jgi:hypothetical protein
LRVGSIISDMDSGPTSEASLDNDGVVVRVGSIISAMETRAAAGTLCSNVDTSASEKSAEMGPLKDNKFDSPL